MASWSLKAIGLPDAFQTAKTVSILNPDALTKKAYISKRIGDIMRQLYLKFLMRQLYLKFLWVITPYWLSPLYHLIGWVPTFKVNYIGNGSRVLIRFYWTKYSQ